MSFNRSGRQWIVLVWSVLSLGSCAGPATSAAARSASALVPPAQAYRELVNALAGDDMEGRGSGSKGLEKAREYVAAGFKAAGLAPACGDSYLQPFPITLWLDARTQELKVLNAEGKPIVQAQPQVHFSALGLSGSGQFDGQCVFVGYAISDPRRKYDSFAGLAGDALKGKVAVAFRYEPMDGNGLSLWTASPGEWTDGAGLLLKADQVAARGAAALLVVNPLPRAAEPLRTWQQTGIWGQARIPIFHIAGGLFRQMLQEAGAPADACEKLQRAADAGTAPPARLEKLTARGQVEMVGRTATIQNVVGWVRGKGPLAGQVIVVGAHYDHVGARDVAGTTATSPAQHLIFHGADDNASGTAGLLMLARQYARAGGSPGRSILFVAFSGEELGLLGSRYLTEHLSQVGLAHDRIVAMVNLDMIGRLKENRLLVWGSESGDLWPEMLRAARDKSGLSIQPGGSAMFPSDQASFYRLKWPVLTFHTGMHLDTHRPTDTPDKINAEGAVKILEAAASVIDQLRAAPAPPAYRPPRTATLPTTRPATQPATRPAGG